MIAIVCSFATPTPLTTAVLLGKRVANRDVVTTWRSKLAATAAVRAPVGHEWP